ncbi:MAG: germination protein YpeB [Clostridia bacterium]|nr:germination protein YpeB [Clostridia bacterium]
MNIQNNKVKELAKRIRAKRMYVFIALLILVIVYVITRMYEEKKSYRTAIENNYNMAFYQLVDNIQDVEVHLAKALISNSPEKGTETLTYIWKEANLAQTYLSMLPISSSELENTAKFLNQVSDYSYALTSKTLNNKELSQEDLNNLEKLHNFSYDLKNILNQLSVDLNDGKISWSELTKEKNPAFAQEVSNITKDSFAFVEENFHEYAGLIYDGAFSEHMTNPERKGLTGENIDEKTAKNVAIKMIGEDRIKKIDLNGVTENANIESYDYTVECTDNNLWWMSVSKKGGHIVSMNSNRSVYSENLDEDQVSMYAEEFLNKNGYTNMKKTYFSKSNGIETINYAYEQDGITVYPDLIKVKVALDNGEILGIETTGYLNSHTTRSIPEVKISKDEAIEKINSNLDILSVDMAIIPTEFQTEITCWEIKGNVNEREFLVYINVENGKEEDILMILNSSEGTLTM